MLTDEQIDAISNGLNGRQPLISIRERGRLIARAIEALVRADCVPQWQPIETAPKEAQLLLTAELDCRGDWRIKTGYYDTGVEAWFVWGASWKPTHWMPLPAAPGITAPTAKD